MIDKSNEPIYKRTDGTYEIASLSGRYHVCPKSIDPLGQYDISEVESYLTDHPDALIDEPKPPKPSAEEKAKRKAAEDEAKEAELDRKWIREQRKKAEKNGGK